MERTREIEVIVRGVVNRVEKKGNMQNSSLIVCLCIKKGKTRVNKANRGSENKEKVRE